MAFVITDQASTIKFASTTGEEYHIDKSNMQIRKGLFFVHVSGGSDPKHTAIGKKIRIRYDEISSPSLASNAELITLLLGYKASSAEVIGDVRITDGTNVVTLEPNGSLPVTLQDQTTPTVITNFSILEQTTTTTAPVAIGDYTLAVTSATGIVAGKYLSVFDPTSVRFMNAYVLSIDTLVVTIDRPFDFAFPSGSYVDISETDLSVNGATTPVIAGLRNNAGGTPPPGIEKTMDVTRVLFHCVTDGASNLTTFGDLAALTRGLVMRRRDGEYHNVFNCKTNAELQGIMYDFEIVATGTVGQGQDGFFGRLTFSGQSKMGVTQRIAIDEDLEIIIQDNLSGLTQLRIIAEGSIVQD